MISFGTRGLRHYTGYTIPILYDRGTDLSLSDERLFRLIFLETGELILSLPGGKRHFPAPVVLFCGDSHNIKSMQITGGEPHHLRFTPEAINTRYDRSVPLNSLADVFFLNPFVQPEGEGFEARAFPPEITSKLTLLFERLHRFLNTQEQEFWPCLSRSYFLEILILMERSRYLEKEATDLKIPETGTRVDCIFHYLHTHYGEELTLEELARQFATNRTTLNRLVQEAGGFSTMAYLNHIRLEIAAGMLRNTHLGISEIAERIGMDDPSYFGRAFRKKTGYSPSDYRDRYPDPYSSAG